MAAAGIRATTTTTVSGVSGRGGKPEAREDAKKKKKEAKHKLNKKQKMVCILYEWRININHNIYDAVICAYVKSWDMYIHRDS